MLGKVSERVADCYHRASECRAKANATFNEALNKEYVNMEHGWLILARSYELNDRLTDYVNEAERRLGLGREQTAIQRIRCPECGRQMGPAPMIKPCPAATQSGYIFGQPDGSQALVIDAKTWAAYEQAANAKGKTAYQIITTAVAEALVAILIDDDVPKSFTRANEPDFLRLRKPKGH